MCLGVPMKVVEILPEDRARVTAGDVDIVVSTQLVEDVTTDDYVLVHAGFAMEVLNMEEAAETLKLLHELADASYGSETKPEEANNNVDC